jgi:hypothetical protein
MSLENFFSNALTVLILFGFFFLIYAKLTKKTLKHAWLDIMSWIEGEDNG